MVREEQTGRQDATRQGAQKKNILDRERCQEITEIMGRGTLDSPLCLQQGLEPF